MQCTVSCQIITGAGKRLKSEQRVLKHRDDDNNSNNSQKHIHRRSLQTLLSLRSRLKCVFCAAAIPVGIVVVRGDCDLETCRLYIDRLQEASSHLRLQDPARCLSSRLPLPPLHIIIIS